jgi:hypothetical protein
MAGRRLQLRVSFCCVIVVREAQFSREIFARRRRMRKILHVFGKAPNGCGPSVERAIAPESGKPLRQLRPVTCSPFWEV